MLCRSARSRSCGTPTPVRTWCTSAPANPTARPTASSASGSRSPKAPPRPIPLDPRVSPWSLEAPDLASKAIYRLAPDPATAGVVYAATTVGLWRRTLDANGLPQWAKVFDPAAAASGCSWLDFLGSSSSQQAPQIYVTDVAIGPAAGGNPQTIYAAVQDVGGQSSQQVWASQSGNDGSWQAVPGFTATDRVALAVSPTDPSVVYALSRGTEPAAGSGTTAVPTNLAKLVNGTFQPVGNAPTNLMGEAGRSQASGTRSSRWTRWTRRDLARRLGDAEPGHPGLERARCSAARSQPGRPRARGRSDSRRLNANTPAKDPSWVGSGAHPDMHAIAFSGPAAAPTVWVGCDGGVFQSTVVTPAPGRRARHGEQHRAGPLAGAQQRPGDHPAELPGPDQRFRLPLAGGHAGQRHPGAHRLRGLDGRRRRRRRRRRDRRRQPQSAVRPVHRLHLVHRRGSRPRLHPDARLLPGRPCGAAAAQRLADREQVLRLLQPGRGATAGQRRDRACLRQPPGLVLRGLGTGLGAGAPAANSWRTLPTGTTNPFEKTNNAGNPAPDQNQDSLHSQVVRVAFADDNQLLVLAQAWPYDPVPRPARVRPRSTCSPGRARHGPRPG